MYIQCDNWGFLNVVKLYRIKLVVKNQQDRTLIITRPRCVVGSCAFYDMFGKNITFYVWL